MFKKIFLIIILQTTSSLSFAVKTFHDQNIVYNFNILAPWKFNNFYPLKQQIEQNCKVKLFNDVYWDNFSLLSVIRRREEDYDIIIMPYSIYNSIKNDIPMFNNNKTFSYNDYLYYYKNFYKEHLRSRNVAIFSISPMIFLYNPNLIKINESESISNIFKSAGSNITILSDDYEAIALLLNKSESQYYSSISNESGIKFEQLLSLTQNTKIYFASDMSNLYKKNNFSFAYLTLSDAASVLNSLHKNYKIVLNKNIRALSIDLAIQIKKNKTTDCVMNILSSKDSQRFLFSNYYITPYKLNKDSQSSNFYNLYALIETNLEKFSIIGNSNDKYTHNIQKWNAIKARYIRLTDESATKSKIR